MYLINSTIPRRYHAYLVCQYAKLLELILFGRSMIAKPVCLRYRVGVVRNSECSVVNVILESWLDSEIPKLIIVAQTRACAPRDL